jgi:hypothetical protein
MHADVHGIEKDPERAFPLFTITSLIPSNNASTRSHMMVAD